MALTRRQILAQRAQHMRENMTWYEKKLWYDFLSQCGVSFRCQKVIGDYIVDFYCRKVRLSIEVDGSSHFSIWSREYDETRTMFLETREIKELRFTNDEIKDNFEGVCEVIFNEIAKRRNDVDSSNFKDLLAKQRQRL